MRSTKVLLVAVIAALVLGLTATANSANAQSQIPTCADQTVFGTILSAMSQGPFADAFSNIAAAATPAEFANIIDLGIQTKHVVGDLSINPTADAGCFYLQLSAIGVLDDEINLAAYQSFIKAGLDSGDAYAKGLADAQTRLEKDNATFQALAQASLPPATAKP